MLISLATMDFTLCQKLGKVLIESGFDIEQIIPGDIPPKETILVVTTEEEYKKVEMDYKKLVILSKTDCLNISKAHAKILLGIEGKNIWESLIIGVDPGLTIGVAIIADGSLKAAFETRDINETMDYILTTINNNPSKMTIIRVGATGGYRQILVLNELLNVKPDYVRVEVVDELQTTPVNWQVVKDELLDGKKVASRLNAGKDATAAMEIAFRLGESVKSPETWQTSEGELKEIQMLSRQYSDGKVTISKELALKVAKGLITIEEAIKQQKGEKK